MSIPMTKEFEKKIINTFFERSKETLLQAYFHEDAQLPAMVPIILDMTEEKAEAHLVEDAMYIQDKYEQLAFIKEVAKKYNTAAVFLATEATMRKYDKDTVSDDKPLDLDDFKEKQDIVILSCESKLGTILEIYIKKDNILVLEQTVNTIEDPSIQIGGEFSNFFNK